LSGRYNQGDVVRVTCTFSFPVQNPGTFFELTHIDDGSVTLVPIGSVVDDLQIFIDPEDDKSCWVDVDTFTRLGSWSYHFYSRTPDHKAGAKDHFAVV
jgi:hypothetical protein